METVGSHHKDGLDWPMETEVRPDWFPKIETYLCNIFLNELQAGFCTTGLCGPPKQLALTSCSTILPCADQLRALLQMLDLEAVIWLEGYLAEWESTLLVVCGWTWIYTPVGNQGESIWSCGSQIAPWHSMSSPPLSFDASENVSQQCQACFLPVVE
jgi:hypothetical protein